MIIIITEDIVKDILKHIGTVRRLGTLEKLNEGGKVYTLMTHD
jgi:cold shock CspA family protein